MNFSNKKSVAGNNLATCPIITGGRWIFELVKIDEVFMSFVKNPTENFR